QERGAHLNLPLRHEAGRHCVTVGSMSASRYTECDGRECLAFSEPRRWEDPRTEERELLWPAMFPEQAVTELAATLGPYGEAGQLQQRPSPESGGIFKREWFPVVPALPADAQVVARCRAWDCAGTEDA